MIFLDFGKEVVNTIINLFEGLFYWIATFIYGLIINLYELFNVLCNTRILEFETIEAIADRIGLLLGIIMFFIVMISAVQMVLDPDKAFDKEKGFGNIIKKVIIVIILIGTSNFAFRTLYEVQSTVIKSNFIGKILIPNHLEEPVENFGGILSSEIFTSFYHLNSKYFDSNGAILADKSTGLVNTCYQNFLDLKTEIVTEKDFSKGLESNCLYESDDESDPIIEFNFLLSVGFGLVAAWFIFSYCVTVGTRSIQLAFLEIIAPMAIISYLSPKKETMLEKWWKVYFATFIDVFIRIAIINFVVFLIAILFQSNGTFSFEKLLPGTSLTVRFLFKPVLIMALFSFAQKAPKLISKFLPSSESGLDFGIDNPMAAAGLGLGIGAIGGAIGGAVAGKGIGRLTGAATGLFRGGAAGMTTKKPLDLGKGAASGYNKAHAATMRNEQRIAAGGSRFNPFARMIAPTMAEKYDKEKADLEKENAAYKSFDSYLDAAEKRAESQILKGEFDENIHTEKALKAKNLAEIYRQQSANVKRSDFTKGTEEEQEQAYQAKLSEYANLATEADKEYIKEMKNAKKDYITAILKGTKVDIPTKQNLELAANVLTVNENNNYELVVTREATDANGNILLDKNGNAIKENVKITGKDLLNGEYKDFDSINSNAKAKQAKNNMAIAKNEQEGKQARANSKYGGSK